MDTEMIAISHDDQPDILKQLAELLAKIADTTGIALFVYAAKEVPSEVEGSVCHKAIGMCRNMSKDIAESIGSQFVTSEMGPHVMEGYLKAKNIHRVH